MRTAPWEFVGKTPLKNLRQPRGMFVWKFEKPGYGTVLRTTNAASFDATPCPPGESVQRQGCPRRESARSRPVWCGSRLTSYIKTLFIPGYEGMPELDLKDYWIDQYEVTNRQFKAFVDQGGYQKHEYWKIDFVRDGKASLLGRGDGRNSAMQPGVPARRTGSEANIPRDKMTIPSPASVGTKPRPTRSLPARACRPSITGTGRQDRFPLRSSCQSATSTPPAEVFCRSAASRAWVRGATYDMAGNVKEWIWTEAESGKRYVLGGAWDEPNYMFIDPDAQSPFLRASNIGFRCVKYIEPESIPKVAMAAMPSPRRDLSKEKPVSDEVFQAYRGLYSYDKTPLNATNGAFPSTDEDWKIERITYDAPYGNERAIAYLFLPKKGKPPYQTVLFFPGSNALNLRKFTLYPTGTLDAILRSGRAVIFPVYKSTYERGDGMESDVSDTSSTWRDHVVMWAKDASRAIDYVESRPDLDHEHIAYYGVQLGCGDGRDHPGGRTAHQGIGARARRTRLPSFAARSRYHQLPAAREAAHPDAERTLRFLLPCGIHARSRSTNCSERNRRNTCSTKADTLSRATNSSRKR